MNPKDLRKKILNILYQKRGEDFVGPEVLSGVLSVSDADIDPEVRYLEEKGLLRIMGEYMGQRYMNFAGIKITAHGVDLVENPDEFNKLFTIHVDTTKETGWYEKPLGQILIGVFVLVVGAGIVYYIGWH